MATNLVENSLEKRQRIFYGWVIVAVAFVILTLSFATRTTFSVFYPTIVEEFGWERGDTAMMFSIAMFVYALMAPAAGALVDRFNPRWVLPIGASIMGAGIALCSLATAQWQFYLLYGVMAAVGLSIVGWTPVSTIVSNWFTKKRGLVFGILGAGFAVSLVSATLVQFLISRFGWQAAYVTIGLFAIIIIVPLCILFMRRSPHDMGLLPDGMPQSPSEPQPPNESLRAASFEMKWADTTWTLLRVMKTYRFWFLLLAAICIFGIVESTMIAHLVYFFQDVGYTPMLAATIYGVFGIMYAVGNLCGFASDRVGREKVFIPSCLLAAGAISLLFLIRDTSHPWIPFLFAVSFGLGLGPAPPVLFATVVDLFQGKHLGSIIGFMVMVFSAGAAIGPWLAGFLYDKTDSYFTTFLILLASLITPAVLMWLVAPRKVRPVPS